MKLRGQLHALAALPLGQRVPIHRIRYYMVLGSGLDAVAGTEKPLLLPRIEHRSYYTIIILVVSS
jgi:hypothetical protein